MPKSKFVLEICAESLDPAVAAERAGAGRIELCSHLAVGGITPSTSLMHATRAHLSIPIHALIRPRAGDFVYSDSELEVMRNDIRVAKQMQMDGIVLGILDTECRVDVIRTRELVEDARPLKVTFHRAFDQVRNLQEGLEHVIDTGADRILTSGSRPNAADDIAELAGLVRAAAGRVVIMPGGGVTAENIVQILTGTSAREIHSSAGASRAASSGTECNGFDPRKYEQRVRQLTSLLDSLPAQK